MPQDASQHFTSPVDEYQSGAHMHECVLAWRLSGVNHKNKPQKGSNVSQAARTTVVQMFDSIAECASMTA